MNLEKPNSQTICEERKFSKEKQIEIIDKFLKRNERLKKKIKKLIAKHQSMEGSNNSHFLEQLKQHELKAKMRDDQILNLFKQNNV